MNPQAKKKGPATSCTEKDENTKTHKPQLNIKRSGGHGTRGTAHQRKVEGNQSEKS